MASQRTLRASANKGIATIEQKYGVFAEGWEKLSADLYDYQAYAIGGQTALNFFQAPIGQNGKTIADTNMQLAGQLPTGQKFLVTGIQVDFLAGNAASATGAIVASNTNDMQIVGNGGALTFSIGVKNYYQSAPLKRFPACQYITGDVALSDATTSAAARVTKIELPKFGGMPCNINPVMIPSTESFGVSLNWPAALPISIAGRIGIRLSGMLYRRSQ